MSAAATKRGFEDSESFDDDEEATRIFQKKMSEVCMHEVGGETLLSFAFLCRSTCSRIELDL